MPLRAPEPGSDVHPDELACMPWYDLSEVRPWTDAFWRGLSGHLRRHGQGAAPRRLRRDIDHDAVLNAPTLWFAQTCGYMVYGRAAELVTAIATPHYRAPGCTGSDYASFVLVRANDQAQSLEDTRGRRCLLNEVHSHSGVNGLRHLVAPLHRGGRFFGGTEILGSHVACLKALRAGVGDVTATDCVTFALLARFRPELVRATRVIATTRPAPAPPFVVSRGRAPELVAPLRAALADWFADPASAPIRDHLLLDGFSILPDAAYAGMMQLRAETRQTGYLELLFEHEDRPAAP